MGASRIFHFAQKPTKNSWRQRMLFPACWKKLSSISKLSHIGYILIAQVINSNIYTLPSYIDASWVFILQFYLIQQLTATYVDRILTYIQRKFHLSFKYKLLSLSLSISKTNLPEYNLPLTTNSPYCLQQQDWVFPQERCLLASSLTTSDIGANNTINLSATHHRSLFS